MPLNHAEVLGVLEGRGLGAASSKKLLKMVHERSLEDAFEKNGEAMRKARALASHLREIKLLKADLISKAEKRQISPIQMLKQSGALQNRLDAILKNHKNFGGETAYGNLAGLFAGLEAEAEGTMLEKNLGAEKAKILLEKIKKNQGIVMAAQSSYINSDEFRKKQ